MKQLLEWIRLTLASLFMLAVISATAASGLMFIEHGANFLVVVLGWACLTISALLVIITIIVLEHIHTRI
tara:strand:+ start:202 stop:411 length:210 start_codon:yes stop_codon:yes gene_type:complete